MKDIISFITALAQQDIKLWLDGDQLRINAPKGALSPAVVGELKARKAAVMDFLRAYQSAATVSTIAPTPRPARIPLSFAQQRLWFLTQLQEQSQDYNSSLVLCLAGPLDAAALCAAFQAIEARHEALRTTFPAVDGQPYQQINPPCLQVQQLDLRALSAAAQEATVLQQAQQMATEPFDLTTGPLWRVQLIKLNEAEHRLLVTMHHIISDGWSMTVLTRELAAFYMQACGQLAPPLAELPVQYADYALWQREQLQGTALSEQMAYWQRQLAGAPPLLALPTDYPRPLVQQHQGAEYRCTLAPALTAALKCAAQRHHVTLFMLLEAAFALLLARYSGQTDIVIGTPVANRQITEIENLIGFFVNTLVLRNDLTGDPTVSDFLARVRRMTLAAFERQALPFELVVEALQPERTLAHSPLFQVLFVLQNNRQPTLALGDVTLKPLEIEQSNARFDLTLMLWEAGDTLVTAWRYNTDLFVPATIARMAGHYQHLLAALVADPAQRMARLPLLSEQERQQLLVTWNAPVPEPVEGTGGICIHQLFEAQVARTPHMPAVVSGDRRLTYRELNTRANQLAYHLRAQGVGPEVIVALWVERTIDMVVALLAILKAGGAYAPLDPTLPVERVQLLLADMQSPLLVTQRHLAATLPGNNCALLSLDDATCFTDQAADQNPNSGVTPANLAYILYTSGSTGNPKGVMVEHRQVVAYGQGVIERCALEPGLRYAMVQPLTVDSSVTMLYPALWSGGELHVIDRELALNANALAATFQRAAIDCLKIAPSHLAALLAAAVDPQAILPRKRLIIGGEASQWQWVQRLLDTAPCQIYNHYGPTETTVGVLTYPIRLDPTGDQFQTSPLGRPLPNTQIYILDPALQPVPVGCWGELYIGGALVTRGYLNRPDLTDECFIANPFGAGRLYKTGDWVRYALLSDGLPVVEFQGRMDGQVKIRGFRIELGEIEAQLHTHPHVRDAIVLAQEKTNGQKQLVAYVTEDKMTRWQDDKIKGSSGHPVILSSSHALNAATLRDYLKQKLPDYMVPAAFVLLDALPLSAHGKVDRRTLLDMPVEPAAQSVAREYIAPHTPIEATLAAIWQQVLGVARVGVTDNFFQIGGDSIISIQIVSRARAAGLHMTPKDLFQHQTIAGLVGVVQQVIQAQAEQVTQAQAEQVTVTGDLPLTPIQLRFFAQQWPNPHHFNQAIRLELTTPVNPTWLQETLEFLLRHHDALRLRFVRHNDQWRQTIVPPTTEIPFVVIDLDRIPATERQAALMEQANVLQCSLNLSDGPLLRVALFQMTDDTQTVTQQLLIVIHHLAVDGVSWRILLADLQQGYEQRAKGEPICLPAKSTSFKRWAILLNEQGPLIAAAERADWAQLAQSAQDILPFDHCLGANDHASLAQIVTRLERAQTTALLNEVPAVYHTQINDLLLTALLLAFQPWIRQPDLLIELEGHGREEQAVGDAGAPVDLSRTVGWFTTIFPVRLSCTSADVGTCIKQVKEQLRQIPNRGIGYGILCYLAGDEALATSTPVRFNYLGQLEQSGGSFIRTIATNGVGLTRSPSAPRAHYLEINAIVSDGELQVTWGYSRNFHRMETIQQLADDYHAALHTLIVHCQTPGMGGYTPSDFPDVDFGQEVLDSVVAAIAVANHANNPQFETPSSAPGAGKRVFDKLSPRHRDENNVANPQIEAIYPLSPTQQGMLLESLASPQAGLHIEQSRFDWAGPLDVAAFTRAWQQLVARHTMLRSGFVWQGHAEPLQFVLPSAPLVVEQQRLGALGGAAAEAEIAVIMAADRQQGFDLMRPPLMRFTLLSTAADTQTTTHVLWSRHHILTDGWSTALMLQEFMALYRAECSGQPIQLPPAPPYQRYIHWLGQQEAAQGATFWRAQLQGFTTPTPVGRQPAPSSEKTTVATRKLLADTEARLSATTTAALYAFCRQQGLTPNTLIQAGWALVLHQISGAIDLLFGATVAGRPSLIDGIEAMVGLFINTLPMRIRLPLESDASLLSWLHALQQQNLAQQAHAHYTAGQIHQWSEVPASRPLYESLLVFENYRRADGEVAGVERHAAEQVNGIRNAHTSGARTNHALTLLVQPSVELRVHAVYDTARFDADEIERLLTQLLAIITAIITESSTAPDQPLSTLLCQHVPRLHTNPPVVESSTVDAGRTPTFVPPRTPLERELVELWQATLALPTIGVRDSFFDLGGHSLIALRLLAQMQQHFGRNLPLSILLQAPTIEQLALHLTRLCRDEAAPWPTLVPIQAAGELPPFFCVPGSGGNVLYLHALARCLGPQQPFYGLQAVGLDGVTPPHTTIDAIAAHNIAAIQQVQPQGPYRLGGHSFGGKVAFAMAQQLLQAGEEVAQLLLFDAAAPTPTPKAAAAQQNDAWWLVGLASAFGELVGQRSQLTEEGLQHLDAEGQLRSFQRELERLNFLPTDADLQQARGLVQVFKSNQRMRYAPSAVLPVPMTLFRATEAVDEAQPDPTLGWARFTTTPVEVIGVPGNHLSMMALPHVAILAERLHARLNTQ